MYNIPADQLPNELQDTSRLDSLFSPLRSQSVNPKDWESKINSWKAIIYLYCINNGVYSFSLSFLNTLFVRHGRPPSCLTTVVQELLNRGELQYVEDYMKSSPSDWTSWATNILLKKPLMWSLNTVRRSLFQPNTKPDQVFVYIEAIRSEAQKMQQQISLNDRNKVISLSKLLEILKKDTSQSSNVELLLHYLKKTGSVDILKMENKKLSNIDRFLIKFMDGEFRPISEHDVSVYVLEQNEELFIKHVEELEDEITKHRSDAKNHLLKGHKVVAKTCLRKKHEAEKRLERKVNALHNIQGLLEKIKDIHTDANVWESYKTALDAFTRTFKETGLSEDAVEDTMLQLGDVLESQENIQSAISRPVLEPSESDEDLDKELEELMKADTQENPDGSLDDLDIQLGKLNLDNLPDLNLSRNKTEELSSSQI